jgi:hypothetical protein
MATEPGTDLHRAALRVADHEKVVRPGGDAPEGTARAVVNDVASDPAETPAERGDCVAVVAAER